MASALSRRGGLGCQRVQRSTILRQPSHAQSLAATMLASIQPRQQRPVPDDATSRHGRTACLWKLSVLCVRTRDARIFARAWCARAYNGKGVATCTGSIPTPCNRDEGACMAGVSETHPRPQLQRPNWGVARWTLGFRPRSRRRLVAPGEVTGIDRSPSLAPETFLSGVAAEDSSARAGTGAPSRLPRRKAGADIPHVRGGRSLRSGVGRRGVCGLSRRRIHTVFDRYHRFLLPGTEHEVILCAEDDPHDLAKPRGKQDWQSNRIPSGIPERPASGRRSGWSGDQSPGSTRYDGSPAWRLGHLL